MERIVVRGRREGRAVTHDISPESQIHLPDAQTSDLVTAYIAHFSLDRERLWMTTDRRQFQHWLGRRIDAGLGGAYVFHPRHRAHLILINLPRIDRSKPKSLEVVVAEELMHMRDWIDGDRRRHAKHGYDRIAFRVAELTGATIEEVRSCLLPKARRPMRYLYRCPGCERTVQRRRRGTWSCARCSPVFDRRFVLLLEAEIVAPVNPSATGDRYDRADEPADRGR